MAIQSLIKNLCLPAVVAGAFNPSTGGGGGGVLKVSPTLPWEKTKQNQFPILFSSLLIKGHVSDLLLSSTEMLRDGKLPQPVLGKCCWVTKLFAIHLELHIS